MILEYQGVLEGQSDDSDLGCIVCLGLSVPILRIITVRGNVLALDISCAMVWSFVVMNLTISGIIHKIAKSVTLTMRS